MPKSIVLHIIAFYICFLTLLKPADAVLERGIAYVDNYDPDSNEEHEWHKRAHGVGVIEIKAERVAAPRAPDFEWNVAPSGDGDANNSNDWGKRDDEERHDWNNKRGIAIGGSDNDADKGSDWHKRANDECYACVKREESEMGWWKRAVEWIDNLRKRTWDSNSVVPTPADDSAPENADTAPDAEQEWGKKRDEDGHFEGSKRGHIYDGKRGQIDGGKRWEGDVHGGPYKPDEANSDWRKREANGDGGDINETLEESHDWLMKRSGTITFEAAQPFPPSGKSLKMNKRGLIEEWMHPHAMEKRQGCQDAGYVPCPNNGGCCRTLSACCATGCKKNPTDVCCSGYSCDSGSECNRLCGGCVIAGGGCCPDGVHSCSAGKSCCPDGCVTTGSKCCSSGGSCRAGYQCCEDGCAVEGNQCCRGGGSCEKGNICVLYKGQEGCCTDLSCTAWISDGVRIPLTPTATREPTRIQTAPPTTAPPDTSTQVVEVYYTYRFTITWWYWWYYYTYYAALDVSTVTSSQSTITTTVSITDTASDAASSQFEAVSSSIVAELTTPAEATTALATPTLPANTAGNAETDTATGLQLTYTGEGFTLTLAEPPGTETPVPLPTSSRRSLRTTSTTTGLNRPLLGGGAKMVEVNCWLGWVMAGLAMGAGMGMLWL